MALNNLQVFNDWVYRTFTEVIAQQVDLFNAATRGAISLGAGSNTGDYSEAAYFGLIAGLVRRRDPYASGAVSSVPLAQLLETHVKVAAGTPPVEMNPSQYEWINMNPEVAGAALGQQLAKATLADMLNNSVAAAIAAIANQASNTNDVTGAADPADDPNFVNLNNTQAKLGDYSGNLVAWVMHSTVLHALYGNALTNAQQLFSYGTVNVTTDPWGRPLIMSDIPATVVAGSPNVYRTLGLVEGAIMVERNSDFTENWDTRNGDENILRTYQAEWSWQLGLKGFTWDKTSGGKAPTNAELATAANWDKIATSSKDLLGVVMISH